MSEIVATPGEVPRPQTESGGAGGRAGLIWPANLLAGRAAERPIRRRCDRGHGADGDRRQPLSRRDARPTQPQPPAARQVGARGAGADPTARPLGISAGIWFVAHSIVAVIELFDFEQSLPAQFVAPDILLGVLATLVRSHGGATAYDQPDGPQRNRDRAQIRKNIDEQVLGGEPIHFRSRAVGPRAVTACRCRERSRCTGRPIRRAWSSARARTGASAGPRGSCRATGGSRPYRGLMGALRVRDSLEVIFEGRIRAG